MSNLQKFLHELFCFISDKLHIQGRSYFLTCVWCFMTWKWGFLLFFYARNYRREINKMETIQVFD